jgi:hypothetical protein
VHPLMRLDDSLSNHVYVDIQVDEARRSKTSMLEIHKAWRKIMRIAKVEELRNDIVWLSAKHVHQVHHLFPLFFTCFHCCNLLQTGVSCCVFICLWCDYGNCLHRWRERITPLQHFKEHWMRQKRSTRMCKPSISQCLIAS